MNYDAVNNTLSIVNPRGAEVVNRLCFGISRVVNYETSSHTDKPLPDLIVHRAVTAVNSS